MAGQPATLPMARGTSVRLALRGLATFGAETYVLVDRLWIGRVEGKG